MALSEEYVVKTCKRGKGEETCKYLSFGSGGWTCLKLNGTLKSAIDSRKDMGAKGDNCEGSQ